MKVSIIGTGYVGLVTGACLAEVGNHVMCFDVDERKIGMLREGEMIHVKGHTSDFMQRIDSMEIEHAHVSEARPGQSVGVRVKEHAREHDVVYKVQQ